MLKKKCIVFVESPSKCKKIKYLLSLIDKTKDFEVIASCGHFREISSIHPKTFSLTYKIQKGKYKYIKNFKEKVKGKEIFIATDNDREGEYIGWHILDYLKENYNTIKRLRFNEISFYALQETYENPDKLDIKLIDAAITRQIIDRWIGFKFSPLLSKFLQKKGLSAGRCQTPTLKLIYENEEIRKKNKKDENNTSFQLKMKVKDEIYLCNFIFQKEEDALKFFRRNTQIDHFFVYPFEKKINKVYPGKAFKTSTIQQFCSTYWKWSAFQTMKELQKLYEAGKITYHRTESTYLSKSFQKKTFEYIDKNYGEKYIRKGNSITDSYAHEAIRPTNIENRFEDSKLYMIIWKQTLQSLMIPKIEEEIMQKINSPEKDIFFIRKEKIILEKGFAILHEKESKVKNQNFTEKDRKEILNIIIDLFEMEEIPCNIIPFYNEGNIINKLEDLKIGRPSTFSTFVSKNLFRGYVEEKDIEERFPKILSYWYFLPNKKNIKKEKKEWIEKEMNKIVMNPLGREVVEYLYKNYSDFFEYDYTSKIEKELDLIARGEEDKDNILKKVQLKLKGD